MGPVVLADGIPEWAKDLPDGAPTLFRRRGGSDGGRASGRGGHPELGALGRGDRGQGGSAAFLVADHGFRVLLCQAGREFLSGEALQGCYDSFH